MAPCFDCLAKMGPVVKVSSKTVDQELIKIFSIIRSRSRIPHRRGHQLPRGHQHMILPNFPKNCSEFEKILDCWEGAHSGAIAIDPPLVICSFDQNI